MLVQLTSLSRSDSLWQAVMPGGAALAGASAESVTAGTWQRFDGVVTELRAAFSAAALQTFFHGEGG